MKIKFILPALTEADGKFLRPIKYSLYSTAWKKADPRWHLLIKLKSLPFCSSVLEKVLDL